MRSSSVAASMYHFCGQAMVYDSDASAYDALMNGEVKPGSVIVVRYAGPYWCAWYGRGRMYGLGDYQPKVR